MFHELMPAIIVLGIAYAIYKLTELFARRRERMALIEKINFSDGTVIPANFADLFSPPRQISWALRLGLLLIGIGLGLGVAAVMNYYMQFNDDDVIYLASMMLFGGAGLLIAYSIERKEKK